MSISVEIYLNGTLKSGSFTATAGDTLRVVLKSGSSYSVNTSGSGYTGTGVDWYFRSVSPGTLGVYLYDSYSETGNSESPTHKKIGSFSFDTVNYSGSTTYNNVKYYSRWSSSTTSDKEFTYTLSKTLPHNFRYHVYFNTPSYYGTAYDGDSTTGYKSISYSYYVTGSPDYYITISNPLTVDSSNSYIYVPRICSIAGAIIQMRNSFADTAIVERSLDGGTTWSQVYSQTGALSLVTSSCSGGTMYYISGSGINNSFTDSEASTFTDTVVYRVTLKNTISKVKTSSYSPGTSQTDILDFSIPSDIALQKKTDVIRESPGSIVINKTTVDLSRVTFKHYFSRSALPGTIIQGVSGTTTYTIYNADENGSIEGNLGCSMFELPNGNYPYRIEPLLDGTGKYNSSSNQVYEQFYYTRSTTKLEMIRPIEMGTTFPKKISLLTNPAKTAYPSGSTVTYYVANNGNDENIVWEELPTTCIGSTASPDVDTFEFSNTEKTADTWKVMVKIVADKGTASSEFKLNAFNVVLNGGKEEKIVPYTFLGTTTLDANATTVSLEMPSGYTKIKITGRIINTSQSGNPYIRVNNLTSGYDTYYCYRYNSSSSSTTNTTQAGLIAYTSSGKCPMFEIDLFNYGTTWYIVSRSHSDTGTTDTHSMITLANGLQSLQLVCNSTSYPMLVGSEFTVIGVR